MRSFQQGVVLLFIVGFFFSGQGVGWAADATGVRLDSVSVSPTGDSIEIEGRFTAYGLNTPIPERDHIDVFLEVANGPGARYPVLPSFYNIAKGCRMAGGKCISQQEEKGVEVTSLPVASLELRKTPVWSSYGGLGKWSSLAPDKVSKDFRGVIPAEFQGKQARLHVMLTHIIGGPNAAWPGISYYHAVKELTLPGGGTRTGRGAGEGGSTRPGGGQDSMEKFYELQQLRADLGMCRQAVAWQVMHIQRLKMNKKAVDDKCLATSAGLSPSGYQAIIDELKSQQYLYRAGANYELVLRDMDPLRHSQQLAERIGLEEAALDRERARCKKLEEQVRELERRIKP